MSTKTLLEVFGQILYRLTRGVTEHYNPDEPEFTAEFFGYNSLESTGREWYCHPVDELIYQEYSDRESTSIEYLLSCSFDVKVTDACSTEENEETQEALKQSKDQTMAWKRLRPSPLQTVFQSIYVGALISLLMAIFVGTIFTMELYLYLKTAHNCEYNTVNSTSVQIQWIRSVSDIIACSFNHFWFFILVLFLFRPFQLMGIRRKLFLVCLITYALDTIYRVALQGLGISHSYISYPLRIPLKVFFFQQSVSAILYFNKVPLPKFTKEIGFIFQNDSTKFFGFLSCHLWGVLNYISSIHERKFKWETFNCNLFSSPWSRGKSSLSYLCSKVVYHLPGILVRLIITGLLWGGCPFSSFASGSWQFTSHSFTWNNSRRCRSH